MAVDMHSCETPCAVKPEIGVGFTSGTAFFAVGARFTRRDALRCQGQKRRQFCVRSRIVSG